MMRWDKDFLKKLFRLSGPIMLQNLFTGLGASVTTLMTGLLGDLPIAAAGLNNQLNFMLMLVQFGISSGSSLFTAQFWGRRDTDNVIKTTGVSLTLGLTAGGIFFLVAQLLPYPFLGLFTRNREAIAIAAGLLRITSYSFFFMPIIYTYSFILRTTGNVRLPLVASVAGVSVNLALGYGLVFGKLGLPNLGVNGAAVALLAARIAESLVLVILAYWLKTPLEAKPGRLFKFERVFVKKILRRVLPVMSNELIWGLGILVYNATFSRMGVESYAAVSIKDTVENLIFMPFFGLTNACAILVGHTIGAGRKEEAQGYVRQTLGVSLSLAAVLGTLLFFSRGLIIRYFNITDATRVLGMNILAALAAVMWLRTSNFVLIIGMLRSGGDTRFAWLMDVISLWGVGVPLVLLGAFVLRLPVYYVYLLVMLEEVLKFTLSIWRFRTRRWIHDLVST